MLRVALAVVLGPLIVLAALSLAAPLPPFACSCGDECPCVSCDCGRPLPGTIPMPGGRYLPPSDRKSLR